MTTVGCHQAANEMKAKYYQCKSEVQWRRWFLKKNIDDNINNKDKEIEYPIY
tara:strand:- start:250 stop:405 length:156 start_codon:yes stop_codon:yes gene_type:complete